MPAEAVRRATGPPLNSLCRPEFWSDPQWRSIGRALALPQDEGWYHRKAWEWTQCAYGLERLGALGPGKLVLAVGAGHEPVLYYMANRSRLTVASDLYDGDFAAGAAEEADPAFLVEPQRFAPFPYHEERLTALRADGCRLPFRNDVFDAVYSLSSIEHFGGHERASAAVREMCRVLRPGGLACIATELVIDGGDHPAYFTWAHFRHFVLEASELSLVAPVDDSPPPQAMIDDPVKLPEDYQRTPHIVLQEGEHKFTSICVFLAKPAQAEAGPARPPAARTPAQAEAGRAQPPDGPGRAGISGPAAADPVWSWRPATGLARLAGAIAVRTRRRYTTWAAKVARR